MAKRALDRAREDPVVLWTAQNPKVWETLLEKGLYRADGRSLYLEDFRPFYHWMKAQMCRRLVFYNHRYPIWAFSRYPYKKEIPDGDFVLKVLIPQARVLLSDFQAWHMVLNDARLDLSKKDKQKSKEETWENIFNFESLDRHEDWGPVEDIQAVFEELFLEDVLEVRTRDKEVIFKKGKK